MKVIDKNCVNCEFNKDDKCKRFPPVPIEFRSCYGENDYSFYVDYGQPEISKNDYCGEFKSKFVYKSEHKPFKK